MDGHGSRRDRSRQARWRYPPARLVRGPDGAPNLLALWEGKAMSAHLSNSDEQVGLPKLRCRNCSTTYYEAYDHKTMGSVCPVCLIAIAPEKPVKRPGAAKKPKERRPSSIGAPGPATKLRVFKRDGYTCTACGEVGGDLTIDHHIPRSKGGTNDIDNLRTMCRGCNEAKGDSMPAL